MSEVLREINMLEGNYEEHLALMVSLDSRTGTEVGCQPKAKLVPDKNTEEMEIGGFLQTILSVFRG